MDDGTESHYFSNPALVNTIKVIIFTTLLIPSVVTSSMIFIHLFTHRHIIRAHHNHAWFLLLVVNFIRVLTSIPFTIHFYRSGSVMIPSAYYCTWLTFYEFTCCAIILFLVLVASIHRHLFIFSRATPLTSRKRFLIYTVPVIMCVVYPIIFYVITVLLDPCNYNNGQWNYRWNLCGALPCFVIFDRFLALFDPLGNNELPIILVMISNMFLVIRVIRQKQQVQARGIVRKNRRMTLLMIAISSIHIILWSPFLFILVVQIFGSPDFAVGIQQNVFGDFIYLDSLLIPYAYFALLPGIEKNPWAMILRRRQRQIGLTN